MNYHTAIEQLRNDLHGNHNSYTTEQLAAGYQQLTTLIQQYLVSEGK